MLNTKETSAPGPHLASKSRSGIHPIHWLWRIHSEPAKAVKNAEAAPAPAQASEPPEADPRAGMDEVAPVLGDPDIVRSSSPQRFPKVQDNAGRVGQPELVLAGE